MKTVFIYCDKDHELDCNNVFLSKPYKDAGEFLKENRDDNFRPLVSYDLQSLIDCGYADEILKENQKLKGIIAKLAKMLPEGENQKKEQKDAVKALKDMGIL